MLTRLAIPCSLILLLIIGIVRAAPGDQAAIDAYHQRVAEAVNGVPLDVNGWIGQQVALPQSAINLLRPNALVARSYAHAERDLSATLLLVHCRDARDMAGHYPPQCYPANGWLEPPGTIGTVRVGEREIRKYKFSRVVGREERAIAVFSFFVLPTGELTTSMDEVRRSGADYEYRKYGAAQFQVVMDAELDPKTRQWVLEQMHEIARPVISEVLRSGVSDAAKVSDGKQI